MGELLNGMLYRERFLNRDISNLQTFERVHRQLRESGSFNASRINDECRPFSARTVRVAEDVFREVKHNLSTSTKSVSLETGCETDTCIGDFA